MTSNGLTRGKSLTGGQQLVSDNGKFSLTMQSDGNLVLYRSSDGKALWSSNTYRSDATYVTMQDDGNLVLYGNDRKRAHWASGTNGHPDSRCMLQDDGDLVVLTAQNNVAWASGTAQEALPASKRVRALNRLGPGQRLGVNHRLVSDNGTFSLTVQSDGNLVISRSSDGGTVWASGTHGKTGAFLTMQTDGNLVVRGSDGRACWETRTDEYPDSHCVLQDDGQLMIYSSRNRPVWAFRKIQDQEPVVDHFTVPREQTRAPQWTPPDGGVSQLGVKARATLRPTDHPYTSLKAGTIVDVECTGLIRVGWLDERRAEDQLEERGADWADDYRIDIASIELEVEGESEEAGTIIIKTVDPYWSSYGEVTGQWPKNCTMSLHLQVDVVGDTVLVQDPVEFELNDVRSIPPVVGSSPCKIDSDGVGLYLTAQYESHLVYVLTGLELTIGSNVPENADNAHATRP